MRFLHVLDGMNGGAPEADLLRTPLFEVRSAIRFESSLTRICLNSSGCLVLRDPNFGRNSTVSSLKRLSLENDDAYFAFEKRRCEGVPRPQSDASPH